MKEYMSEHEIQQARQQRAATVTLNINTIITTIILAGIVGLGGLSLRSYERLVTLETTVRLSLETINHRLTVLEDGKPNGSNGQNRP